MELKSIHLLNIFIILFLAVIVIFGITNTVINYSMLDILNGQSQTAGILTSIVPSPAVCKGPCMLKPFITATYPTAGSTLIQGRTYDITWKSTGVDKVSIQLVHGTSGYDVAVAIPASSGKYTWTVPTYPGPNTNYKINIFTWPDSNTVFSSSGLFTIATGGGSGATGFTGGGN